MPFRRDNYMLLSTVHRMLPRAYCNGEKREKKTKARRRETQLSSSCLEASRRVTSKVVMPAMSTFMLTRFRMRPSGNLKANTAHFGIALSMKLSVQAGRDMPDCARDTRTYETWPPAGPLRVHRRTATTRSASGLWRKAQPCAWQTSRESM